MRKGGRCVRERGRCRGDGNSLRELQVGDNGRQVKVETGRADGLGRKDERKQPQANVFESGDNLGLVEVRFTRPRRAGRQARLQEGPLALREPLGLGRKVGQAEPDDGAEEDGEEALDEEEPLPAGEAAAARSKVEAVREEGADDVGEELKGVCVR